MINFAASLTSGGPASILLTNGELVINKSLTINGPGANLLTVDAQLASRVIEITAGAFTVDIGGLRLTNGRSQRPERRRHSGSIDGPRDDPR